MIDLFLKEEEAFEYVFYKIFLYIYYIIETKDYFLSFRAGTFELIYNKN